MGTADNTAAGVKIRKWDEVNGLQEEQNEPGTTPQDHIDGPLLQTGNRNYLKSAEELAEDDFSSIDGIINNGERHKSNLDSDEEQEKAKKSVMDKIRENEEKQRHFPPAMPPVIQSPEKEKDPLCPDRTLC